MNYILDKYIAEWRGSPSNPCLLPWYVAPNYADGGVSATILNAKGEQVATFESIAEAREVVTRINGEQA